MYDLTKSEDVHVKTNPYSTRSTLSFFIVLKLMDFAFDSPRPIVSKDIVRKNQEMFREENPQLCK